MADSDKNEAPVTVQDVMVLLDDAMPTLYCSRCGGPRISLSDDPKTRSWAVDSSRTRAWIAELGHRHSLYPSSAVLGQVVRILEGIAWTNMVAADDPGLINLYDEEPVVEALEQLMEDKDIYIKRATELLVVLQSQSDRYQYNRRWPRGPAALMRRLRSQAEMLGELGLTVSAHHTRTGTEVTVTRFDARRDDVGIKPSHEASLAKSPGANDLGQCDDNDETNSELLSILHPKGSKHAT